jgi:hypothetical protein
MYINVNAELNEGMCIHVMGIFNLNVLCAGGTVQLDDLFVVKNQLN